ncbi:hypothetical protein ACIRL2_43885 [Embleya sp. NPDC127516]|jgi:hypothetical protein|uniref:hypothetical protein n=1 Tax=Embleya sp. NPDC127516 TaxID=3363990 RepID=UPI003800FBAF
MRDDDSIVGNLGPTTWSQRDALAYEVALEGLNLLTARYTRLVHEEQRSAKPDPMKIQAWEAELDRWADIPGTLTPADPEKVEEVTATCSALLKTLKSGR